MKKDKEWLKEELNELPLSFLGFSVLKLREEFTVNKDDVLELIEQLDEPQKPVVPQFVADYIEQSKKDNDSINQVFAFIDDKEDKDLWHWLFPSLYEEKRANQEVFMRAWLDGYEVEKEKRYHVVNKENYFMLRKYDGLVDILRTSPSMSRDKYGKDTRFMLTEKEIKDYDKRFWAFAEEVTK